MSVLTNESTSNNKEAIFLALSQVPHGRVISYGQLARLAGFPGAARWVGSALRQLPPGSSLAWHRVVNSRGEIALPPNSPGYHEQHCRLEREGVAFSRGKINMQRFGWPQ